MRSTPYWVAPSDCCVTAAAWRHRVCALDRPNVRYPVSSFWYVHQSTPNPWILFLTILFIRYHHMRHTLAQCYLNVFWLPMEIIQSSCLKVSIYICIYIYLPLIFSFIQAPSFTNWPVKNSTDYKWEKYCPRFLLNNIPLYYHQRVYSLSCFYKILHIHAHIIRFF